MQDRILGDTPDSEDQQMWFLSKHVFTNCSSNGRAKQIIKQEFSKLQWTATQNRADITSYLDRISQNTYPNWVIPVGEDHGDILLQFIWR